MSVCGEDFFWLVVVVRGKKDDTFLRGLGSLEIAELSIQASAAAVAEPKSQQKIKY